MSRSRKRRIWRTVLIVLLALVVICGGAAYAAQKLYIYYRDFDEAFIPDNDAKTSISIASGSTTGAIADKLEEFGIIESSGTFRLKARILGLDTKWQAGTYQLGPGMTMNEIMEALQHAKRDTKRFTVQEGLTLAQVGEKLAKEGIVASEEDFYKALELEYGYWFLDGVTGEYADPSGKISAKGNRLEGFLYPDTYEVYEDSTARDVINKMLAQFNKKVPDSTKVTLAALNQKLGTNYTLRNIVTVASIIEMETYSAAQDGPGVASVIYNRLAQNMNLQSDVTVLYALNKTGGARVLNKDLEASYSSPYSTYGTSFKGLPAGPICSPTADSIKAALAPIDSNYLYFCVAADGSNRLLFTASYQEHLKNAKAWQKYMYGD